MHPVYRGAMALSVIGINNRDNWGLSGYLTTRRCFPVLVRGGGTRLGDGTGAIASGVSASCSQGTPPRPTAMAPIAR